MLSRGGIVPRCCQELFSFIDTQCHDEPHMKYEVSASMIELYMEKIYDLFDETNQKIAVQPITQQTLALASANAAAAAAAATAAAATSYNTNNNSNNSNASTLLAVNAAQTAESIYLQRLSQRKHLDIQVDHRCGSVIIPGVKRITVQNYEQIEGWLKKGEKARTRMSTNLNDTSSRAHTIFTIEVTTFIVRSYSCMNVMHACTYVCMNVCMYGTMMCSCCVLCFVCFVQFRAYNTVSKTATRSKINLVVQLHYTTRHYTTRTLHARHYLHLQHLSFSTGFVCMCVRV